MENKILEFVGILRKNGLKISLSESVDALRAVGFTSLEDRTGLKDSLRSSLVKDRLDVAAYDELFDLYFSGLKGIFDADSLLSGMVFAGRLSESSLRALAKILDELPGELHGTWPSTPLTQYLLSGDADLVEGIVKELESLLGLEKMENHLQIGFYTQTLFSRLPWEAVRKDVETLEEKLRQSGFSPEDIQAIHQEINKRKQAFKDALKEFVGKEFRKQNFGYFERSKDHWLSERNFYSLSEAEIRRMKDVVRRLAQRLKNVAAIRQKKAQKGRVDLKRTLRKSQRFGGVPFELVMRIKRKEKPRLVLLCDISESVRNVSRFMLQFIYTVQELFSRVRTFVFVSDIGEVTQLFKDRDIDRAINSAYRGEVINVFLHSDFGHAFRVFHRNYLSAVNKKTTVVIIGDGRNNYNDPSAWALEEISKKAKEVIWLNPEHPATWGFGDSVMDKYLPSCNVVEEVRNLKQLSHVIDRLVLHTRRPYSSLKERKVH